MASRIFDRFAALRVLDPIPLLQLNHNYGAKALFHFCGEMKDRPTGKPAIDNFYIVGLGNRPPSGNRRRLVEQGVEGVMTFGDRRLFDQARLPLLSSSSFPLGPLELRSSRKTVV